MFVCDGLVTAHSIFLVVVQIRSPFEKHAQFVYKRPNSRKKAPGWSTESLWFCITLNWLRGLATIRIV